MSGSEPMELLGQRIKTLVEKGDNMLASAAVCALEARKRFDAGETEGFEAWGVWWITRTGLSDRRCRQLLQIGRAADPVAAATASKEKNRKAVAKHRATKAELRNSAQEPTLTEDQWALLKEWKATRDRKLSARSEKAKKARLSAATNPKEEHRDSWARFYGGVTLCGMNWDVDPTNAQARYESLGGTKTLEENLAIRAANKAAAQAQDEADALALVQEILKNGASGKFRNALLDLLMYQTKEPTTP